MKKILIDCTSLRDKPSGVGFYTYKLIEALHKIQKENDFSLGIYCQPSMKQWLIGNINFPEKLQQYSPFYRFPFPVTITNLLAQYFPSFLNSYDYLFDKPNLIHGTDHYVYPCKDTKRVMTIHDLTFLKYPIYSNSIVKTYTKRIKKCLEWTDLIITFSNNSKQDIMRYLGVKEDKIYITSEASRYPANFLNQETIKKLKSSINYNFEIPYLLFVSTLEPRKNLVNLVRAFNLLKQEYKIPHNLILIGKKGWDYSQIFKTINRSIFRDSIYYLEYLPDELVALYYTQADIFVYPSFYEGFGLPVLESMTLGCPVVTSNTSCLPEVAGDAAYFINPNDPTSIAYGINKVINDNQLRQNLIDKGKKRAASFSWEKTAQQTINAYQQIL
jgi:glycosyltransferase involved in cell wall biosynthesis